MNDRSAGHTKRENDIRVKSDTTPPTLSFCLGPEEESAFIQIKAVELHSFKSRILLQAPLLTMPPLLRQRPRTTCLPTCLNVITPLCVACMCLTNLFTYLHRYNLENIHLVRLVDLLNTFRCKSCQGAQGRCPSPQGSGVAGRPTPQPLWLLRHWSRAAANRTAPSASARRQPPGPEQRRPPQQEPEPWCPLPRLDLPVIL